MIYLDNAATSYPKPHSVIREVGRCVRHYCGNPGRSGHRLSIKAAEKIFEARERVCELLNYDSPERVAFTPNATYALNLAIKGLIRERCHVLISDLEHNSVIRPVSDVQKKYGGEISVFPTDIPLRDAIHPLIREDTRFIISTSVSNVLGKEIDIYELSQLAHEHGIFLILDLSQSLGHKVVDAARLHFAALCAPGHKALLGLQGSGLVIFGKGVTPETIIQGGSGNDTVNRDMPRLLPERMEAGTLFTPSIVGLSAGIKYLMSYGLPCVEQRIASYTELLGDRLSSIKGLTVYGVENGIAAFNLGNISSEAMASRLNERGICVRGGLHCSPLVHARLGTLGRGAVRISLSVFTSKRDLDRLYTCIKQELK